jgi:hypothetical protein
MNAATSQQLDDLATCWKMLEQSEQVQQALVQM